MKFRIITREIAAGSYTVEADDREHAEGIMASPARIQWELVQQNDFSVFRVSIESIEAIES